MTEPSKHDPARGPVWLLVERLWRSQDVVVRALVVLALVVTAVAVIVGGGLAAPDTNAYWTAISAIATIVGTGVAAFALLQLKDSVAAQVQAMGVSSRQLEHEQRRTEPVFLASTVRAHWFAIGIRSIDGRGNTLSRGRRDFRRTGFFDQLDITVRNDGGIAFEFRIFVEGTVNTFTPRFVGDYLPYQGQVKNLQPGEEYKGTLYLAWTDDEHRRMLGRGNNAYNRQKLAHFASGRAQDLPILRHGRPQPRVVIEYINFELIRKRQHFVLDFGFYTPPMPYPLDAGFRLLRIETFADASEVGKAFRDPPCP
ncbi:MAG: hypothetical protein AB7G13_32990 [Lautropia sp.]